jgi:hypothetical protein
MNSNRTIVSDINATPELADDLTEEETVEILALTLDEEDLFERTVRIQISTQEAL